MSTNTIDAADTVLAERNGRGPDVFIVGAPRCGTTALATFLAQHPDVFLPFVKEPHYFGSDLTPRRGFPTLDSYLELYADAGVRRALDASTWYLYSERAAREIAEFEPNARIVIMLRDPVELIHSWHGHAVLRGIEPLTSFGEAIAAEADRREGRRLPPEAPVERLLYTAIPRFTEQVKRYIDVFGRDRVHVIFHEDFRLDNVGVVREVYRFIEVDPTFEPEVSIVNPEARPRSKAVQNLLFRQPDAVRSLVRRVLPKRIRSVLRHSLAELNEAPSTRTPMDPATERRLRESFAPELAQLSALLGRDLTA